jgi:hypothetical protein
VKTNTIEQAEIARQIVLEQRIDNVMIFGVFFVPFAIALMVVAVAGYLWWKDTKPNAFDRFAPILATATIVAAFAGSMATLAANGVIDTYIAPDLVAKRMGAFNP